MKVCLNTSMYVYMVLWTYVCVGVMYMCVHMYVCLNVYMYVCKCMCVHVWMHMWMCTMYELESGN